MEEVDDDYSISDELAVTSPSVADKASSLFDMIDEFSRELDQIVNNISTADSNRNAQNADEEDIVHNDDDSDEDDDIGDRFLQWKACKLQNKLQKINIIAYDAATTATTTDNKTTSQSSANNGNGSPLPYTEESLSTPTSASKQSKWSTQIVDETVTAATTSTTTATVAASNVSSWFTSLISNNLQSTKSSFSSTASQHTMVFLTHEQPTDITIGARSVLKIPYFIPKNTSVLLKCMIQKHDIKFSINVRVQEDMGGSSESCIEPVLLLLSSMTYPSIAYRKKCDFDRYLIFVFDNSYSKLTSKLCYYKVYTGTAADDEISKIIENTTTIAVDTSADTAASTGAMAQKPTLATLLSIGSMVDIITINDQLRLKIGHVMQTISTYSNTMKDAAQDEISTHYQTIMNIASSSSISSSSNTNIDDKVEVDEILDVEAVEEIESNACVVDESLHAHAAISTDVTILPNKYINPNHFESLYISTDSYLFQERIVTLQLRPNAGTSAPVLLLPRHLTGVCGVYQVAKGIVDNGTGVRIFR